MRRKEYFIIPILLLFLLIQFVPYQITNVFGQTIILTAELYDPRDVFRGDYVAINFAQETVDSELFVTDEVELWKLYNKKLFARLEEQDLEVKSNGANSGVWQVVEVTEKRPKNGVYIECRLDYFNEHENVGMLDFGVDRYYVEANTGGVIEDAARENRLQTKMKVWRGQLIMTDIIVK